MLPFVVLLLLLLLLLLLVRLWCSHLLCYILMLLLLRVAWEGDNQCAVGLRVCGDLVCSDIRRQLVLALEGPGTARALLYHQSASLRPVQVEGQGVALVGGRVHSQCVGLVRDLGTGPVSGVARLIHHLLLLLLLLLLPDCVHAVGQILPPLGKQGLLFGKLLPRCCQLTPRLQLALALRLTLLENALLLLFPQLTLPTLLFQSALLLLELLLLAELLLLELLLLLLLLVVDVAAAWDHVEEVAMASKGSLEKVVEA